MERKWLRSGQLSAIAQRAPIGHPSGGCSSEPLISSITARWRHLLPSWLLALGLSAALVWAGQHWSTPLLEQPWALAHPAAPLQLALLLVLLPPALMALLIAGRMLRHHDKGESFD